MEQSEDLLKPLVTIAGVDVPHADLPI